MLWLPGQRDRRWGWRTAPRVLFSPPHTVVKQTTSERRPHINITAAPWPQTGSVSIPSELQHQGHMVSRFCDGFTNGHKCVFLDSIDITETVLGMI